MGQSLIEIAQTLRDTNKKVQLIYAFNGVGKTRLSREFKKLIDQKDDTDGADQEELGPKILYYNAYTEDLFYWDNDLDGDTERKLQIQPNEFRRNSNLYKKFSKVRGLCLCRYRKMALSWAWVYSINRYS